MDALDPKLWESSGLPAPEVISGTRRVAAKAVYSGLAPLQAAATRLNIKVCHEACLSCLYS